MNILIILISEIQCKSKSYTCYVYQEKVRILTGKVRLKFAWWNLRRIFPRAGAQTFKKGSMPGAWWGCSWECSKNQVEVCQSRGPTWGHSLKKRLGRNKKVPSYFSFVFTSPYSASYSQNSVGSTLKGEMKFVQFNASVRKYRRVDLQLRDNSLDTNSLRRKLFWCPV